MIEKTYTTQAGSTVRIFGPHGGRVSISWNWFDEDACFDSDPTWDENTKTISAECDCCEASPFTAETKGAA